SGFSLRGAWPRSPGSASGRRAGAPEGRRTMSTGAQYVVAAYAVIWFVLLLYVVVVAARTQRIARELEVMSRLADERGEEQVDALPRDEAAPRETAPEPTR